MGTEDTNPDPVERALDDALEAWRVGGDRVALRRALARVLLKLDD